MLIASLAVASSSSSPPSFSPSQSPSMTASLPLTLIAPLTYRPVEPSSPEDKAILIAMRKACGWGVADVPVNLANIAAGSEAMWIFSIEGEPAGMGGIVFEGKLPECSSRKEGRMMISELHRCPCIVWWFVQVADRGFHLYSPTLPLRQVPGQVLRQPGESSELSSRC